MNSCTQDLRKGASRYQATLDEITGAVGLPSISVFESAAGNACATHYILNNGHSVPIISYSPFFMRRLEDDSYVNIIGVLAHEVGHHYNQDLFDKDVPWFLMKSFSHQKELNADRFAGYILNRYGCSLQESLGLLDFLGAAASSTHPSRADRIKAVSIGWKEGSFEFPIRKRVSIPKFTRSDVRSIVGFALLGVLAIGAASVVVRNA